MEEQKNVKTEKMQATGTVRGLFFSLGTTPDTSDPKFDCAKALINLFNQAKQIIHIAIYSITEPDIVDAIIAAHKRGVSVAIVADKTESKTRSMAAAIEKLTQAGVNVRIAVRQTGLMHNKISILDGQTVATGSYNYTVSAEKYNDENLIIIDGKDVATDYEKYVFQRILQTESLKLGKKAHKKDDRDLMWKNYVNRAVLPPLPKPPFGHANLVKNWGMLANDQLGDCVIAGSCHDTMLDNAEGGHPITFTEQDAITAYSDACGYNPNDPSSDNGCEIRIVLSYCKKVGLKDANNKVHKIDAYVQLDKTNIKEVYESIHLFGKAKLGIQIPQSAIDQFNADQPWTVVPGSTIEGGHDIEAVEVLANGSLQVVTWGKLQEMTIPFFEKYCDEAWSPLSKEMLTKKGISLEGFNWTQLEKDLAAIKSIK